MHLSILVICNYETLFQSFEIKSVCIDCFALFEFLLIYVIPN